MRIWLPGALRHYAASLILLNTMRDSLPAPPFLHISRPNVAVQSRRAALAAEVCIRMVHDLRRER